MLKRNLDLICGNYYLEFFEDIIVIAMHPYYISNNFNLLKNLSFLRFNFLLDIFAVDYSFLQRRFQINYLLFSVVFKQKLLVKVLSDEKTFIQSVKFFFPSADWAEREIWDLFGFFFSYSLSLRRILTDYGFVGHPLRRDFPLSGYLAVRWSSLFLKIVSEPVSLAQEYRIFETQNPWNQI